MNPIATPSDYYKTQMISNVRLTNNSQILSVKICVNVSCYSKRNINQMMVTLTINQMIDLLTIQMPS